MTAEEQARERARAREILDVQEGRLDRRLLDDAGTTALLRRARRIAVVGASPNPLRPSNEVLRYLVGAGYEIVPVNPAEAEVEGLTCYPTLAAAVAAEGPVDIVDVFRRAELCPSHAAEAVEVGARCLWLQLGIASAEAARVADAGGLSVIMDRCLLVEHARLLRRLAPGRPDVSP